MLALGISCVLVSCACSKVEQPQRDNPMDHTEDPIDFSDSVIVLDLRAMNAVNVANKDEAAKLWDTFHAVSSVQGIVNRDMPRLYVKYVYSGSTDVDTYWWDKYRRTGKWLANKKVRETTDPLVAFEYFKSLVNGLVVWDPAIASTSNVASTVAGADNLIAVRYDTNPNSMYSKLIKMGFSVKVWLLNEDGTSKFKGKLEPYRWAIDNYLKMGKCDTRYAAYYIDGYWIDHAAQATANHHCVTNHDFFIGKKAFFFDLSPWQDEQATDVNSTTYPKQPTAAMGADRKMMREILLEMYQRNGNGKTFTHIGGFPAWAFKYTKFGSIGGIHGEVDTEWEFARLISAYNAYKDADAIAYGAMANASFWKSFPLQEKYSQKWTTVEELKSKGYLTADGKVNTSKKYFIFYVGDYDAASWLYQVVPTIWDNSDRGSLPMMWAISPALEVRAPMAMDYIRSSASSKDYFVAADNGAGYLNPSMLQAPRDISSLPDALNDWANHCKPMYERWDLTVSGFIIDGFANGMSDKCFACYKKFSPNGIVVQKLDRLATNYEGMPILKYGPDIVDNNGSTAGTNLASYLNNNHSSFPFYWARAILKSPTWYSQVKAQTEAQCPSVEWVDAPTFFMLLKIYLGEGHSIPSK